MLWQRGKRIRLVQCRRSWGCSCTPKEKNFGAKSKSCIPKNIRSPTAMDLWTGVELKLWAGQIWYRLKRLAIL